MENEDEIEQPTTREDRYRKALEKYAGDLVWDQDVSTKGVAVYTAGYVLADMDEDGIDPDLESEVIEKITADVEEVAGTIDRKHTTRLVGAIRRALRSRAKWMHDHQLDGGDAYVPDGFVRQQPSLKPWQTPPTPADIRDTIEKIAHGRAWLEKERTIRNEPKLKASKLLTLATQMSRPKGSEEQAATYVRTISKWVRGVCGIDQPKFWAGGKYDIGEGTVRTADEWAEAWLSGSEEVLPFVSINPMTGEGIDDTDKNGEPIVSYRRKQLVAKWMFSLVEFDDMPLEDQACYWLGVLLDGDMEVISITFTGGKSLHGIILTPVVEGAGGAFTEANHAAAWGRAKDDPEKRTPPEVLTWGPLTRKLMSNDKRTFCSDPNNINCLVTRLPGHMRTDFKTPHEPTPAVLLWLAEPPEVEAAPPISSGADTHSTSLSHFVRRCADCPANVFAVCRHAFGDKWGEKSSDGQGCNHPMDKVAEQWMAHGWPNLTTPDIELPPHVAEIVRWIDTDKPEGIDDYCRKYIVCTKIIEPWIEQRFKKALDTKRI